VTTLSGSAVPTAARIVPTAIGPKSIRRAGPEHAEAGPMVLTGVLPQADSKRSARDRAWFLVIFVVKVGLGLIAFTPWLFDTPLMLAGAATLAAITCLRLPLSAGKLTAERPAVAAAFYGAFAIGLAVLV
jgi:hypothetical protein